MKFTHVGVYHRLHEELEPEGKILEAHNYHFRLGGRNDLPKHLQLDETPQKGRFTRVAALKLPNHTVLEIQRLENTLPEHIRLDNQLGWINYRLETRPQVATIAVSRALFPKHRYELEMFQNKRVLSGLGAFLEHACAVHLATQGVTHYSTTHALRHARVGQLKKLGLPIDEPVPINDWIAALKKGFPKPPESRIKRAAGAIKGMLRRRRR